MITRVYINSIKLLYRTLLLSVISVIFAVGCTSSLAKNIQEQQKTPTPSELLYNSIVVNLKAKPYDPNVDEIDIDNVVNLDDIEQSDLKKSDIEIIITRGSQVFFFLNPINSALGYYSGKKSVDYDLCRKNLSEFSDSARPELLSGLPICVLTNEGRIGIIQVVNEFSHNKDDDTYNVSLLITVFNTNENE